MCLPRVRGRCTQTTDRHLLSVLSNPTLWICLLSPLLTASASPLRIRPTSKADEFPEHVPSTASPATPQEWPAMTPLRSEEKDEWGPKEPQPSEEDLNFEFAKATAEEPPATQFELAMMHTVTAVKAGLAPDPALRKPDGQPGTLLDALLPEDASLSDKDKAVRRALFRSRRRVFGLNIDFTSGPSVAALNATFFRYDSVSVPYSVDWRRTIYVTPIQVQYDCASCWAMAAADTVAMAAAIGSNRRAVAASAQQICDCNGQGCCSGGWPEDAFSYLLLQGNISTKDAYGYWATDNGVCLWNPSMPTAGSLTGWERVPAFSQQSLMEAVAMQPVLVYIAAESEDFQSYTSPPLGGVNPINIYNGNCSMEVNHAMVAVGYDAAAGYWILKNSWPADGWGDRGYMYIAMQDGPGKCGMLSVSPVYPVNYPQAPNQVTVPAGSVNPRLRFSSRGYWWNWWVPPSGYNPCANIINPCGGGVCIPYGGIARCSCYWPYVEVIGAPTSKCVHSSPCTNSLINPCGAGTCMDVGDGSYTCACPTGYFVTARVDGAPTCTPSSGANALTYMAQYGDNCTNLETKFGISDPVFQSLNPFINCSTPLVPGIVVYLGNTSSTSCSQQYALRPLQGDTCAVVAYLMRNPNFPPWLRSYSRLQDVPRLYYYVPSSVLWNPSSVDLSPLLALNPALNCDPSSAGPSLLQYQPICITNASIAASSAVLIRCGATYTTQKWDTCWSVMWTYNLNSTYFLQLNPGLNCNFNGGSFAAGVQLCVGSAPPRNKTSGSDSGPDPSCTQFYTVQQGDTCAHIWNAANLSQFQFLYINPGLQCQSPYLYTGQRVCVDSPALANISDPSFLTYLVAPNDTWSTIQSRFTRQCDPSSITIPKIARANGIDSEAWDSFNFSAIAGASIIIPCLSRVGASCGCAPSLPVCGVDNVNYQSYCDATCNFALPVVQGSCTNCQLACAGRYGRPPSPTSACSQGYTCPWPTWPPPAAAAAQTFNNNSPLCSYRGATCLRICSQMVAAFGTSASGTCLNSCMACNRVPCSGPSEQVSSGTSTCSKCDSAGCKATPGRSCLTDCTYWNTFWNPLNP